MTLIETACFAAATAYHDRTAVDYDTAMRFLPAVRATLASVRNSSNAAQERRLAEWETATDFGAHESEPEDMKLVFTSMIDALLAE